MADRHQHTRLLCSVVSARFVMMVVERANKPKALTAASGD